MISSQYKNLIGAVLLGLAMFSAWGFVVPAYEKFSTLRPLIQERGKFYDSRKQLVENIKNLNAEYQSRSKDIDRLAAILPRKKDVSEILSALEAISSKAGVRFHSASFSTPSSNVASNINVISVNVELNGSYSVLKSYLEMVEKNLRLIDIQSIQVGKSEISATSEEGPEIPKTEELSFQIKMDAYFLK